MIGEMKTIGPPTKFSALDYSVRGPAPWLGQHTAEVLREIGVSDDDITTLFADEVVFDARPELHDHPRRPLRRKRPDMSDAPRWWSATPTPGIATVVPSTGRDGPQRDLNVATYRRPARPGARHWTPTRR